MSVVTGAFGRLYEPGQPISLEGWTGLAPKLARMDRLCGLATVACSSALRDAALDPNDTSWCGDRTAIVFGSAYGCHATNEQYYRQLRAEGPSPRLFAYTLPSSPAGELSIQHRITGPVTTLTAGRTAGLDALAEAQALIDSGRADRAVCVAAEVGTPLLESLLGIQTSDAAGAIILEKAEGARARGGPRRGRLLAYAKRFSSTGLEGAKREAAAEVLDRAGLRNDAIRLTLDASSERSTLAALGAAPLILAARFFAGPEIAYALLVSSDPEGDVAAAVLGGAS